MLIAHCFVSVKYQQAVIGAQNIVGLWHEESLQSAEFMTVNTVNICEQKGKAYGIMANLTLPSLWSEKNVNQLQLGLANALAKYYNAPLKEAHVLTTIIPSGLVVENGQLVTW